MEKCTKREVIILYFVTILVTVIITTASFAIYYDSNAAEILKILSILGMFSSIILSVLAIWYAFIQTLLADSSSKIIQQMLIDLRLVIQGVETAFGSSSTQIDKKLVNVDFKISEFSKTLKDKIPSLLTTNNDRMSYNTNNINDNQCRLLIDSDHCCIGILKCLKSKFVISIIKIVYSSHENQIPINKLTSAYGELGILKVEDKTEQFVINTVACTTILTILKDLHILDYRDTLFVKPESQTLITKYFTDMADTNKKLFTAIETLEDEVKRLLAV